MNTNQTTNQSQEEMGHSKEQEKQWLVSLRTVKVLEPLAKSICEGKSAQRLLSKLESALVADFADLRSERNNLRAELDINKPLLISSQEENARLKFALSAAQAKADWFDECIKSLYYLFPAGSEGGDKLRAILSSDEKAKEG